jgi:hypothetical protein
MRGSVRSSSLRVLMALALAGAVVALAGCVTITPPATQPAPQPAPAPAPAASNAAFKTGDRVAAPWGGAQYIGTVTAVTGDKAAVLYDDDKITRQIAFADLVPVTVKTWSVGDKVMAVWSSGKFYAGTITAVSPAGIYTVKWDDGSSPSDVEAAKIFAR